MLWYFCGYGIGRTIIEGMRTDQLIIGNTGIAVSQLLSLVLAVIAIILIVMLRIKMKDNQPVWGDDRLKEIEKPSEE